MIDVAAIVEGLAGAEVDYVLTGSVAALAYGVPVAPRDFDIAPALDDENLARLAGLLRRWDARPIPLPDWPEGLTPEQCARWRPEPATATQLDHLMTTPHGLFDVVPIRSGRYADLVTRALPLEFGTRRVRVAHPDDLLATMRLHKEKHERRAPHVTAIRERLLRGEAVDMGLPSLIA